MPARLKRYGPEIALALAALFFAYRELGTFPGAWLDESLFIMTARNLAEGRGYAIDLLDNFWHFPYFLAVGPTVIVPVAAALKLFGISVTAARLPMTLYLLGTCAVMYFFTRRIADRPSARWTTALLITLSAFVNTGKPVLGEVPAFFFLLLGFWALERTKHPWLRGLLTGMLFGLAILTKITFAVVLVALFAAFVTALVRRRFRDALAMGIAGTVAPLVVLPWRIVEILHTPAGSLTEEIGRFVFGGGDVPMLFVLRETPELLLRIPYLAYAVIVILGGLGLWRTRAKSETRIVIGGTIVLFTLYFLNGEGWYRHLLPAHLLLLPFVPAGIVRLLRRRIASIALALIVCVQGVWQLSHRGAGQGTALAETVRIVEENYAETNLLIEQAEVYAQLPWNPQHWRFLIRDRVSPTMPASFLNPDNPERCWKRLRKLNADELALYGKNAVRVGNAHIIPSPDCSR